jgi:hypothetical protein
MSVPPMSRVSEVASIMSSLLSKERGPGQFSVVGLGAVSGVRD